MSTDDVSRRAFMRTAGGTVAAAGVGASATGSAAAQEKPKWPSPVQNANVGSYKDARGQDEVTIKVGAGDGLAFDPTKVWIDPGTTVTWEWTGSGGNHNVETVDGPAEFESKIVGEEGHTFSVEFTEDHTGITHYQCQPHAQIGMHGGIAVGGDVETTGGEGGGKAAGVVFVPDAAKALGVATFFAMVATLAFAFAFLKYGTVSPSE